MKHLQKDNGDELNRKTGKKKTPKLFLPQLNPRMTTKIDPDYYRVVA